MVKMPGPKPKGQKTEYPTWHSDGTIMWRNEQDRWVEQEAFNRSLLNPKRFDLYLSGKPSPRKPTPGKPRKA